jgi:hypothetical protein
MKYSLLVVGAIGLLADDALAFKISAHSLNRNRDEYDDQNIQIKNIYGIPSEQEKQQMQAQLIAKQNKIKIQNMRKDLQTAFTNFSKTLKESEFDKAMKLREQLQENNESLASLEKIKIDSVDFFKKGFQFPEVAKNDFSTEVLDELEIAEKNLNSNLDNVDLYNTFIETAEACKKKLKEKYQDQWSDPAVANVQALAQNDDDE